MESKKFKNHHSNPDNVIETPKPCTNSDKLNEFRIKDCYVKLEKINASSNETSSSDTEGIIPINHQLANLEAQNIRSLDQYSSEYSSVINKPIKNLILKRNSDKHWHITPNLKNNKIKKLRIGLRNNSQSTRRESRNETAEWQHLPDTQLIRDSSLHQDRRERREKRQEAIDSLRHKAVAGQSEIECSSDAQNNALTKAHSDKVSTADKNTSDDVGKISKYQNIPSPFPTPSFSPPATSQYGFSPKETTDFPESVTTKPKYQNILSSFPPPSFSPLAIYQYGLSPEETTDFPENDPGKINPKPPEIKIQKCLSPSPSSPSPLRPPFSPPATLQYTLSPEEMTDSPDLNPKTPTATPERMETNTPTREEDIPPSTSLKINNPRNITIRENVMMPSNLRETEDNLELSKDNIICFLYDDGNPIDATGIQLIEQGWVPKLNDEITFGMSSVLVHKMRNKTIFGLIIKNRDSQEIYERDVIDAFKNLIIKMQEIDIYSASISQGQSNFNENTWRNIKNMLRLLLLDTDIGITICKDQIKTPNKNEITQIIEENHVTSFSGHKGVTKTYDRIRKNYFWTNMKRDIEEFIKRCKSCQLKKLDRNKTKQPMVLTDTSYKTMDKVALDIVGPLELTANGNKYVLTMQDDLSKFCLAAPLKTMDGKAVAKAFIEHFVAFFGCPKAILTDQGTNFNSLVMKSMAEKFKIKQIKTTSFHPQSNGALERSHQVLKDYLKHYTNKHDWDEWLPLAMFAYNTSKHEATQFTPYEIIFGHPARMPSETRTVDPLPTYNDYIFELESRLIEIRNTARLNQDRAKEKSKKYYDKNCRPADFQVGQRVYILKNIKKGKLDDSYLGPYPIIKTFPEKNNIKILIDNKTNKTRIIHSNQAKLAYSDDSMSE